MQHNPYGIPRFAESGIWWRLWKSENFCTPSQGTLTYTWIATYGAHTGHWHCRNWLKLSHHSTGLSAFQIMILIFFFPNGSQISLNFCEEYYVFIFMWTFGISNARLHRDGMKRFQKKNLLMAIREFFKTPFHDSLSQEHGFQKCSELTSKLCQQHLKHQRDLWPSRMPLTRAPTKSSRTTT